MNMAIKGHVTRYKEVIELLEMLGGENNEGHNGNNPNVAYYISHTNTIVCNWDYNGYTLEEFLKRYPYKVEDKVQHRGATSCGTVYVIEHMNWVNDHIEYEIRPLFDYNHTGLVTVLTEDLQPYKEETMKERNKPIDIKEFKIKFEIPEGYEFGCVDDNNVVLIPKQPKYPKTYVECAKILDCFSAYNIDGYKDELLIKLQELLICRDAYWEIAGKELGLGKPWKPDWDNYDDTKYCIYTTENIISLDLFGVDNKILAFPTEKMRNAFYKNFKELIEACKYFL